MTLVGGPCGLPVSALWEWLLAIACMAPNAVVIRAFQLQDCLRGVPCSPCAHCGCRPLAISPEIVSCPWEPWKPTWGHMVRSFMTADRCERREEGRWTICLRWLHSAVVGVCPFVRCVWQQMTCRRRAARSKQKSLISTLAIVYRRYRKALRGIGRHAQDVPGLAPFAQEPCSIKAGVQ